MRRTITISVSDDMHELIYKGVRSHYYSTVSEYIRFLVRRDQRPDAVVIPDPVADQDEDFDTGFDMLNGSVTREEILREIEAERKALASRGIVRL